MVLVGMCMHLACLMPAAGADYYVAPSGDDSTGADWASAYNGLQDAITAAAEGDNIYLKQGTYTNAAGEISIDGKSLFIRGGYVGSGTPGVSVTNASLTVQDADNANRVLYIANCTSGLVENLTVQNGESAAIGGGIYLLSATNTFRDCIIANNETTGSNIDGGGFYASSSSNLFERCVIRDNSTSGSGSGLYALNSDLRLDYCTISDNAPNAYGKTGGAFFQNKGTLVLRHSVIEGNISHNSPLNSGGAAIVPTLLFNCLIRQNGVTGPDHGVIQQAANPGSVMTISNCTVIGNWPMGIERTANGSINVVNSIVWGNGDDLKSVATVSYSCIEDEDSGDGVIHIDPQVSDRYYLGSSSPCIGTGTGTVAEVGLTGTYAESDTLDTGTVDMGYHHDTVLTNTVPDLYVSPAGDDGQDGTNWATSVRSITRALELVSVGTRVNIAAGNYTNGVETFPVVLDTDAVQLLGTNAATTIIDAEGSGQRVMTVDGVGAGTTIINITMQGGEPSTDAAGLLVENSDLLIQYCVISDNISPGSYHVGNLHSRYSDLTLDHCELTDGSTAYAKVGSGFHQQYGNLEILNSIMAGNQAERVPFLAEGPGTTRIVNSLIYSNTSAGLVYGTVRALYVTMEIENCTVVDNSMGIERSQGSISVINSIIWNNVDDIDGTVTLAYCNIEDGDNDGVNGCISLDPLFVDTNAANYQLDKGSPSIDTGFDLDWMSGATDLDGNKRRQAGRVDMGCYESAAIILGTVFMLL